MLDRFLVASALLLNLAGPAMAQAAPRATAPVAPGHTPAMQLAHSAAAGVEAALERTQASLDALVRQPSAPQTPMTLKVFRSGAPLPVRPLYGPGAIAVDRATMATLHRVGHVVHYYPTPAPRFLVAADTKIGWHRALGVDIPVTQIAQALDTVPLPAGATLDLLSERGELLGHPERPLSPEALTLAATLPGRAERALAVDDSVLAYSPVGDSGVGILVKAAGAAPATRSALVARRAPVVTATPTVVRRHRVDPLRRFAHGPYPAAILGLLCAGALLLLILYLRQRWHDQLRGLEAPVRGTPGSLEEASRLAALATSTLPTLRESLGSAARSLDRAYVAGTGAPRQLQEAYGLAQDLTDQAAGLRERLQQAREGTPSEGAPWRDLSAQITQLALDLALAAAQPNRTDEVLKVAGQLRELAGAVAGLESASGDRGPGFAYLIELTNSLHGRCERLEGVLAATGNDEPLSPQLQIARDAVERGLAQVNLLSDRLRSLERNLSIPEESPED